MTTINVYGRSMNEKPQASLNAVPFTDASFWTLGTNLAKSSIGDWHSSGFLLLHQRNHLITTDRWILIVM